MTNHEVISAFLDNEPFDPAALVQALAERDGRELLLDLVALRALIADDAIATPMPRTRATASRATWIAAGFLAASLIFGAGAAWLLPPLLRQQHADVPPHPDRVVTFETAPDAS